MPENYSNPLAPDSAAAAGGDRSSSHALRNEDFRKLLMTPRPSGGSQSHSASTASSAVPPTTELIKEPAASSSGGGGGSGKQKKRFNPHHKPRPKPKREGEEGGEEEDEDDDESREHLRMIMNKYRDRAKERRHGETSTGDVPGMDLLQATAGYRAMAPDARTNLDAAERRRRMIEESKYLGGDMEHTHLVKGLDYALLQKVRAEITAKERESMKKGPQPPETIFDADLEQQEPEPKFL